jgi:hypothetical protein
VATQEPAADAQLAVTGDDGLALQPRDADQVSAILATTPGLPQSQASRDRLREAIQIIIKIAAANGVGTVWVGRGGEVGGVVAGATAHTRVHVPHARARARAQASSRRPPCRA